MAEFSKWVENMWEKEKLLVFPQCFKDLYSRHTQKTGLFWERDLLTTKWLMYTATDANDTTFKVIARLYDIHQEALQVTGGGGGGKS